MAAAAVATAAVCGARGHPQGAQAALRLSGTARRACSAFFVRPAGVPGAQRKVVRVQATMQSDAMDCPVAAPLAGERSALVNKEVVLFLFQLEMDTQLQRALTYEDFDAAQQIRERRQQVDEALKELQQIKGPGCGARLSSKSDQMELAPQLLSLKSQMQAAVESERYQDAAALRDRLRVVEARAAEAAEASAAYTCALTQPRFNLGQMVVHSCQGYRGVVVGWDVKCCESEEWQEQAGVNALRGGARQLFYHLLVDVRDWPAHEEVPPIAYVAEERLSAASGANFAEEAPLVDGTFQHPYSYHLFLGADGQGNLLPCRQLRDKYCAERRDVYSVGESEWDDEGGDGDGGDAGDGGSTPSGGWPTLPGIDMRSLE